MQPLFQIEERTPTRYALSGHSTTDPKMTYYLAAHDAGEKTLGKPFFKSANSWCWTIIKNLADRASAKDLLMIASVLKKWITEVEPQFAAIPGKVGYNITPGTHRTIKTADGRDHGGRSEAATHTLKLMFNQLRPKLDNATVRALCNANLYGKHDGDESQFYYERGLIALVGIQGDDYRFKVNRVQRMHDAIRAMGEVKNTPLEVR